jgi:hypothetical protein
LIERYRSIWRDFGLRIPGRGNGILFARKLDKEDYRSHETTLADPFVSKQQGCFSFVFNKKTGTQTGA